MKDIETAFDLMKAAPPGKRDENAIVQALMPYAEQQAKNNAKRYRNDSHASRLDYDAFISAGQLALLELAKKTKLSDSIKTAAHFEACVRRGINNRMTDVVRRERGTGTNRIIAASIDALLGSDEGMAGVNKALTSHFGETAIAEVDMQDTLAALDKALKNNLTPNEHKAIATTIHMRQEGHNNEEALAATGMKKFTYYEHMRNTREIAADYLAHMDIEAPPPRKRQR